jgi:uncharacterized protein YneF (UPF0154 family)
MESVIAVFIPIITVIVTGLAFVTWIYFKSKEKQMVIERGLDAELVKALFEKKKSPYALLKTGIVLLFFGIGLGSGLLIETYTGVEEWIPFLIFAGLGIGFILAFFIARKLEQNDKAKNSD